MIHQDVKKQWVIKGSVPDELCVRSLTDKYRLSSLCAGLIASRCDNDTERSKDFFYKDNRESPDPFLMSDMKKAVTRINQAVEEKNDIIAVYGDYDVDGVTAVSLMYLYLCSLGLRVGYYIPSRTEEGYGVSKEAITNLHERGVTLIVTVDTGITAINEVEYAKKLGIDVIITDHHECRPELPEALAVINPHRTDCQYPFKELCGCGVAYKLVCAVEASRAEKLGAPPAEAQRKVLLKYGDLVAIGTVADVMPVIGENRTIVSVGLRVIEHMPRMGISALMKVANANSSSARVINTSYIGFTVAPRLNAAGRMGNASIAVELLLADKASVADQLAANLCELNRQRQNEENKIVQTATEKLEEEWGKYLKDNAVIVLEDDHWQQGIIGIVASRIMERYGLPTILITFEGMPTPQYPSAYDIGKGSGRSIKGLNLADALADSADLLEKYGGHELAAGLSIRRSALDEFRKRINDYARPILNSIDRVITLEADFEVQARDLTMTFAREIANVIEPCGIGNPTPLFVLCNAKLLSIRPIGAGKHLKYSIEKDGTVFTAVQFGISEGQMGFHVGEMIDILFSVDINRYNGASTLQLIVSDMRYAESVFAERKHIRNRLHAVLKGGHFTAQEAFLPTREDFVALYKFLSPHLKDKFIPFIDDVTMKTFEECFPPECKPNFVKYRLMLEVFAELDLIKIEYVSIVSDEMGDRWNLPNDICMIRKGSAAKTNLDDSKLLSRLRTQLITTEDV